MSSDGTYGIVGNHFGDDLFINFDKKWFIEKPTSFYLKMDIFKNIL